MVNRHLIKIVRNDEDMRDFISRSQVETGGVGKPTDITGTNTSGIRGHTECPFNLIDGDSIDPLPENRSTFTPSVVVECILGAVLQ